MKVVIAFVLLLVLLGHVECKFKFVFCTVYDKDYGEFPVCKLKAINRYRNAITVLYRQIMYAEKVMVRLEILKKANGWRPFIYDISIDLCEFLGKRNHIVFNVAYQYLSPYLTLNDTCPFRLNSTIFCDKFEWDLDQFRVRFPIETGEYGLRMSFYHQKVLRLVVNGSAEYSNYKEH